MVRKEQKQGQTHGQWACSAAPQHFSCRHQQKKAFLDSLEICRLRQHQCYIHIYPIKLGLWQYLQPKYRLVGLYFRSCSLGDSQQPLHRAGTIGWGIPFHPEPAAKWPELLVPWVGWNRCRLLSRAQMSLHMKTLGRQNLQVWICTCVPLLKVWAQCYKNTHTHTKPQPCLPLLQTKHNALLFPLPVLKVELLTVRGPHCSEMKH